MKFVDARPDRKRTAAHEPVCWECHAYLLDLIPLCSWQWVGGMTCRKVDILTSELERVAYHVGHTLDAKSLVEIRTVINEMVRLDNHKQG